MRLDLRVTGVPQIETLAEVFEEAAELLSRGATFVEAESTAPAEGELHRVIVRSDALDEPKVFAAKEQ